MSLIYALWAGECFFLWFRNPFLSRLITANYGKKLGFRRKLPQSLFKTKVQYSRSSVSCAQINLKTCFHLHFFTIRSQTTASLETNPLKTQPASQAHILLTFNFGTMRHLWNDFLTAQKIPPKFFVDLNACVSECPSWIKHPSWKN